MASLLFISSSSSLMDQQHQLLVRPMLFLLFLSISLFSMCFLFISLYKRLKRTKEEDEHNSNQKSLNIFGCSVSSTIKNNHQTQQTNKSTKTHQTHPLLVKVLTSNSPKWASLIPYFPAHLLIDDDGEIGDNCLSNGLEFHKVGSDSVGEECGRSGDQIGRKKKKRSKKKRQNSQAEDGGENQCLGCQLLALQDKQDLDCLYPFTSSSSVTQKKIKQQYDKLLKPHDSKASTMAQVSQFANCLIEARNELLHKSAIIQRKFTITKALLFKAERSSFDRLRQQIYKLEAEQKRIEEDTVVYNRLHQQLELLPAYKKMLETGSRVESKDSSDQLVESTDGEFANISFEELLAQEKKDAFWQRNGKLRSCTN